MTDMEPLPISWEKEVAPPFADLEAPSTADMSFGELKMSYDPCRYADFSGDAGPQTVEIAYVERSWTFSPRGRASVVSGRAEFEGYLGEFEPAESEGGEFPESVVTITAVGDIK